MPTWMFSQKPPLTLKGWSVSAHRTSLWIPELKLGLDAGGIDPKTGEEPKSLQIILITHGHRDHTKEIHNLALNGPDQHDITDSRYKTKIFLPESIKNSVSDFIKNSAELNAGGRQLTIRESNQIEKCYEIFPVIDRYSYTVKKYNGSTNLQISTFKCYHYPTTVGYGISEIRKISKTDKDICEIIKKRTDDTIEHHKKDTFNIILYCFSKGIKPEGKYYKFMREEKIDFCTDITIPYFVFLCDTTTQVFEDKHVFSYPVIIIECTYYESNEYIIKEAKDRNHIHFNLLIPIIKNNPDNLFRLIHHSSRYEKEDNFNPNNIFEEFDNLKKYHNRYINRSKLTELYTKDEIDIEIQQIELEIKKRAIRNDSASKLVKKKDYLNGILLQYTYMPIDNPHYIPNFSIHI